MFSRLKSLHTLFLIVIVHYLNLRKWLKFISRWLIYIIKTMFGENEHCTLYSVQYSSSKNDLTSKSLNQIVANFWKQTISWNSPSFKIRIWVWNIFSQYRANIFRYIDHLQYHIYNLLVCPPARLYQINVKTAEPIRHIFCGTSHDPRGGLRMLKITKFVSKFFLDFCKILTPPPRKKSTKMLLLFYRRGNAEILRNN